MEKPVIISIRGVQSLEPGEEDVMELVTQGVLRQEEGEGFSLSYLESELTGLEGTTTTFRIAAGPDHPPAGGHTQLGDDLSGGAEARLPV